MTGQRDFQSAAERGAEHRRHHRLRSVLDFRVQIDQARSLRRLVELGDVGAGDKSAARASQHNRGDILVGIRTCEGIAKAEPYVVPQCIDRRIIDDDDGDVAVALHGNY